MPRDRSKEDRDTYILQTYADYLNGIINHTITDSRLSVLKKNPPFFLITRFEPRTGRYQPLELRPGSWLHFRQIVFVCSDSVLPSSVIVQEYRYTYSLSPNSDDEQAWIFRYDYCREPELNVPHAHLHVNASDGGQQLKHIHFPTGRLSFEQVICHLVSECGVRVRNSDWKDCLVKSHSDFVGKLSAQELHQFP